MGFNFDFFVPHLKGIHLSRITAHLFPPLDDGLPVQWVQVHFDAIKFLDQKIDQFFGFLIFEMGFNVFLVQSRFIQESFLRLLLLHSQNGGQGHKYPIKLLGRFGFLPGLSVIISIVFCNFRQISGPRRRNHIDLFGHFLSHFQGRS